MPKLSGVTEKLVDIALAKYNVPKWAWPYIRKYAARSNVDTIKLAIGFISIGRRKGKIEKDRIYLPNGMSFKMDSLMKLLNIFFHGAQNIAKLEEHWATCYSVGNPEYEAHFAQQAISDYAIARALKNLMEGLKYKAGDNPKSIEPLFRRIEELESWEERTVAMGVVMNYSFMRIFGSIFFKAFYPTVPEFMRSFGKAFADKQGPERWEAIEARSIIQSGRISSERTTELCLELLALVRNSIDGMMKLAKELKLEKEISLLRDISIAYPLHALREMGVDIDPEKEAEKILKGRAKK